METGCNTSTVIKWKLLLQGKKSEPFCFAVTTDSFRLLNDPSNNVIP